MFSDATLDQILALDYKLLRYLLSRVGAHEQQETKNLYFLSAEAFKNEVLNNCVTLWLIASERGSRNFDDELIACLKKLAPQLEGLLKIGICNSIDIKDRISFESSSSLGFTIFFGPGFSTEYTGELVEKNTIIYTDRTLKKL